MNDPLVETWAIHNRINLFLLEGIPDESLSAFHPPKSRTVFDLFAHMHNVRLMWLKVAAPELMDGLEKLEPKTLGTREQLVTALTDSGRAMESLIAKSLENGGKVKNFKPHVSAFVGYLISHESHHRGHIEWVLRFTGQALDDKVGYGIWEWGAR